MSAEMPPRIWALPKTGLWVPAEGSYRPTSIATEFVRADIADGLLEELKGARNCIEFWGSEATLYLQQKHDLTGDLAKLDAAIARAEAG